MKSPEADPDQRPVLARAVHLPRNASARTEVSRATVSVCTGTPTSPRSPRCSTRPARRSSWRWATAAGLPASGSRQRGIAPSTASAHLARLLDAGFLSVERHGRHRYFRLSGPEVGALPRGAGPLRPAAPVRSLKQGTRAEALRFARTCYDHLAGRLGSALMAAMLRDGLLEGGDGTFDADAARHDRLSAPGGDLDYRLTAARQRRARRLRHRPRRPPAPASLIRYCVDWTRAAPPSRGRARRRPRAAHARPRLGRATARRRRAARDRRGLAGLRSASAWSWLVPSSARRARPSFPRRPSRAAGRGSRRGSSASPGR